MTSVSVNTQQEDHKDELGTVRGVIQPHKDI